MLQENLIQFFLLGTNRWINENVSNDLLPRLDAIRNRPASLNGRIDGVLLHLWLQGIAVEKRSFIFLQSVAAILSTFSGLVYLPSWIVKNVHWILFYSVFSFIIISAFPNALLTALGFLHVLMILLIWHYKTEISFFFRNTILDVVCVLTFGGAIKIVASTYKHLNYIEINEGVPKYLIHLGECYELSDDNEYKQMKNLFLDELEEAERKKDWECLEQRVDQYWQNAVGESKKL